MGEILILEGRVQKIVADHGGQVFLTEGKPLTVHDTLRLACRYGHAWNMPCYNLLRGRWCIQCFFDEKVRKSYEELCDFVKKMGGECLSDFSDYKGTASILPFRCEAGHEWKTTARNVKSGTWCRKCFENEKLDALREIAKKHNGKFLSKKYAGFRKKYLFRCEAKHEFLKSPSEVRTKGEWCRKCLGEEKKSQTEKKLHAIVKKHGGAIISPKYEDWKKPLIVRCKEAHIWNAQAGHIVAGVWCAVCFHEGLKKGLPALERLAQKRDGVCLAKEYVQFGTRYLWKCKNRHEFRLSGQSVEDGGWCPICSRGVTTKLNIGIMQEEAAKKNGKCLSIRYLNNRAKLLWECEEGHQWQSSAGEIRNGSWCPKCAKRRGRSIEDLKKIAREKGGECLSDIYEGYKGRILLKCAKGHLWTTIAQSLFSGDWCGKCAYAKRAWNLSDVQKIAKKHGGECLAASYKNSREPILWRCKLGHKWRETTAAVSRGKWCPACKFKRKSEIGVRAGIAVSAN